MKNRISVLVAAAFLTACGGKNFSAPRELDNACAIADERPQYMRAMQRAERQWGVPVAVQMATIHQESKFIGNARTPHQYALGIIPMGRQSSAYGYAQALDGTWEDYKRATGNRRASRDDIDDAADFMGWYMRQTNQRHGVPLHDARNLYLAYHEGQTGYARASYRQKPWLMNVAENVASRANLYNAQLISCRRA
jgi:hypothetical protein